MEIYEKYIKQIGDRFKMYKNIIQEYDIKSILYPGSHVDITPSIIVPKVVYIDNFKGTQKFFENTENLYNYLVNKKIYSEKPEFEFIFDDYYSQLKIEPVDMLISQFAGFVGQATKKYLKKGGILLANDSHGDATIAYMDDDFEFIGVVLEDDEISHLDLSKYFKHKRKLNIDIDKVYKTMKGPNYHIQAKSYIFKRK